MESNETLINIEFKRLLNIIKSKKLYLIAIMLIAITIGYIYSFYYKVPLYSSSSTVILAKSDSDIEQNNASITQGDINLNQKLISTYSQIIKSNKVLGTTIENLGLNKSISELNSKITVSAVTNTEIIKISVRDTSPQQAAKIANELVEVFSNEVKQIYHIDNVNVIDKAQIASSPSNVNHAKDMIMFTGMGILFSCALIFGIYFFDTTIKDEKDVEEYLKSTVLAAVPLYKNKNKETFSELITEQENQSPIAEYFRNLKMNLTFKQTDKETKTILITSGSSGEGKSWISANLAVIFAQAHKDVLIIDADMRKGRQNKVFEVSNKQGLSNCLSMDYGNRKMTIEQIAPFIQETKIPGLHLLPNGCVPPNPSEMLSSDRMKKLLEETSRVYDIVIIDGSPCKIVSDSIGLANMIDTTVIVTESRKTKIEDVQNIKKQIETLGGNVSGIVLNKIHISPKVYKSSYYYSDNGKEKLIPEETSKQIESKTVQQIIDEARLKNIQQRKEEFVNIMEPEQIEEIADTSDMKELLVELTNKLGNEKALEHKFKQEWIYQLEEIKEDILLNLKREISKNKENVTKDQEEQFNEMKQSIEYLKKDVLKLGDKKEEEEKLSRISEDIEKIKGLYKSYLTDNEEKQEEWEMQLTRLQEEYQKTIQQINYTKQLEEISTRIDMLQDNKDQEILKVQLAQLQNEYRETIKQFDYSEELTEIINRMDMIQNNSNQEDFKTQLLQLQNQYQETIKQFDYSKELAEIINRMDMLQDSNEQEVLKIQLKQLQNQYQEILEQFNYSSELEEINQRIDMLQDSNDEKEIKIQLEQLQNQYQEMIDSSDYSNKLQEISSKIQVLQENQGQETLKMQLLQLQNQYQETIDQLDYTSELEEIRRKIDMLQDNQEQEELKEQLRNMQKQYEETIQSIDYSTQLEEINQKINQMQDVGDQKELRIQIENMQRQYEEAIKQFDYSSELQVIMNKINEIQNSQEQETIKIQLEDMKEQYQNIIEEVKRVKQNNQGEMANSLESQMSKMEEQIKQTIQKQEEFYQTIQQQAEMEKRKEEDRQRRLDVLTDRMIEVTQSIRDIKNIYLKQEENTYHQRELISHMKEQVSQLQENMKKQEVTKEYKPFHEENNSKVVNINTWKQNESYLQEEEEKSSIFKNMFNKKTKKEALGNDISYEDLEDNAMYTCQILNPTSKNVI